MSITKKILYKISEETGVNNPSNPPALDNNDSVIYNSIVNYIKGTLSFVPKEDKEYEKVKEILKKDTKDHTQDEIKTILNFAYRYRTMISHQYRKNLKKDLESILQSNARKAFKNFKNKYNFDISLFARPTVKETIAQTKLEQTAEQLRQIEQELGETREQLKRTHGLLERARGGLKELAGKYYEERKAREKTQEELGEARRQLGETQKALSKEIERKHELGRVIRYGVPGVGGLTAGYIFGPIWGPILGGGSGILSNLLTQMMQGESLRDIKTYLGPVGMGIGTGLVGGLLRNIIRKRQKI